MNYSKNKKRRIKRKKIILVSAVLLAVTAFSITIMSLAVRNSKLNSKLLHAEAMAAETVPEEEETTSEPAESSNPYKDIKLARYEMDYLARILALEAQGEPFEGQVAVVEVIFNRVLSDEYPDSVYKVLSQEGQFCSWKYLENPYNTPNQTQWDVIDFVLDYGPTVIPMHCYENGYEDPERYIFFATYEANGTDFFQIGNHYFGKG